MQVGCCVPGPGSAQEPQGCLAERGAALGPEQDKIFPKEGMASRLAAKSLTGTKVLTHIHHVCQM